MGRSRPSRNFMELGHLMYDHDIYYSDIAEWVGKSYPYVSARFVGELSWSLSDMYIISDKFFELTGGEVDISEDFKKYFPHPDTYINSREMVRKLRKGASC